MRPVFPSLLAATMLAPLALAASLAATPAMAAEAESPWPRITVTGEGRAALAPDMAILSLSVLREAETAREALSANNGAMAEVMTAMKEAGIAERDVQTANFSIEPRYVYPQTKDGVSEPPRIVGYAVSNSLSVRVRDLSKLGAVLDRAVTLGVNQGGGISFANDDPAEAITQARAAAMKDALAKAKTLTDAAGIGLGKIVEISEMSYQPQPVPMMQARMAAAQAEAVPVAAGENAYSVSVTVSFGLVQ